MKTAISIVMTLALTALCGCTSGSPEGGGLSQDDGFKIVVPAFGTKIKQGETQSVVVTLNRGGFFKEDVALEIKPAKGISLEPTSILVKASDKPELQLRISAAKDAAIGDYLVDVKGSPKTGAATSTHFVVNVIAP